MSGMDRGELSGEMKDLARRKSSLILEGRLAKESGSDDDAARLFGEAASLEERLAEVYSAQGISEQVWRHRFSAAGCWSQAGNFLRALELCDALTNDGSSPEALRVRAAEYARTLRDRRNRLWAEIYQSQLSLAAA